MGVKIKIDEHHKESIMKYVRLRPQTSSRTPLYGSIPSIRPWLTHEGLSGDLHPRHYHGSVSEVVFQTLCFAGWKAEPA